MANIQHKAIAAGFIHALHDPAVFAKWEAAKDNPAALTKLIQETLGLAQAPSASDMDEMKAYAEQHLQDDHASLTEAQPNAPRTVGYMFTMQS